MHVRQRLQATIKLANNARAMGMTEGVDPAMASTLEFEDMATAPPMPIYDTLMLKHKSCAMSWTLAVNNTMDRTHLDRNEEALVYTMTIRHGIAEPYISLRNSMGFGNVVRSKANSSWSMLHQYI